MTAVLTALALAAFAANSVLCRMALAGQLIDPVSFTTIRLGSGAIALALLARLVRDGDTPRASSGSWRSGLALFVYAVAFSLAYVSLGAGTGALILFASVQATMIGSALLAGERLRAMQWLGGAAALGGLVYLVLPGLAAPDPLGAALMCAAGIAWGAYSIRGIGAPAPIAMTAGNFGRAAPFGLIATVAALSLARVEPLGATLATVSGVITSGLGYVLWYSALRGLTATRAAIVQLTVPVLAAFGGVIFLSEHVTVRLMLASVWILGGVALAVFGRTMARARR